MELREALYTTRAMRRVKPDPIPQEVQARILDAAVRAPSGGNTQNWRFLLVDDPDVKAKLGPLYRECMAILWSSYYKDRIDAAQCIRLILITGRPAPGHDDAPAATFVRWRRGRPSWLQHRKPHGATRRLPAGVSVPFRKWSRRSTAVSWATRSDAVFTSEFDSL